MADMTKVIAPKSDQMNNEDLRTGPRTFTITEVRVGESEQPVSVFLAEFSPKRPFKPSKTVMRMMVEAWGKESTAYVGKRLTLYTDPEITFGPMKTGGIRVSHMSGIPRQLRVSLPTAKGRWSTYTIDPIPGGPPPSPLAALVAALEASGVRGKGPMLEYCRGVVARAIGSAQDLTPAEIDQVHEALVAARSTAIPPDPVAAAADNPGEFTPTGTPGVYGYQPPGEPSEAELAAAYEQEQGPDRG